MSLGLSFLTRLNNRKEIKHTYACICTHTQENEKGHTEEFIRTANTQEGLREQQEFGLWGPAAQFQTPIQLCHSLAVGPAASHFTAEGLASSSIGWKYKEYLLRGVDVRIKSDLVYGPLCDKSSRNVSTQLLSDQEQGRRVRLEGSWQISEES